MKFTEAIKLENKDLVLELAKTKHACDPVLKQCINAVSEDERISVICCYLSWLWCNNIVTEIDLPDYLSLKYGLDLEYIPIKKLPNCLYVRGWLNLRGTSITEFSKHITVSQGIDMRQTPIQKIPDHLSCGGPILTDFNLDRPFVIQNYPFGEFGKGRGKPVNFQIIIDE